MDHSNLPWSQMKAPEISTVFSSEPTDFFTKWPTYWIVDYSGNYGLLIQCDGANLSKQKLPKLEFLECTVEITDAGSQILVFLLKDKSKQETFYDFCKSITEAIEKESTIDLAVGTAIRKVWEWLRLLKGKSGGLSKVEQRGLIGELLFLSQYLAKSIGIEDAVKAWTGPLGAPKDFNISHYAIEVKTHSVSAQPSISISSENQLSRSGYENVWLTVFNFSEAAEGQAEAYSLGEVYKKVSKQIGEVSQSALDEFNNLMVASGFGVTVDYSENKWISTGESFYHVSDSFPMIDSSDLPVGVAKVKYSIELAALEQHRVGYENIEKLIRQVNHD